MKRLDNKVAIVTGASKGIGAGIAKAFGAEGATVVVNYALARSAWCARSPAKAGDPLPYKATWLRGPTPAALL
jgi:NAD(P)-dependent dehydrogenase (short-subunit alcohol dehydrogenase family)